MSLKGKQQDSSSPPEFDFSDPLRPVLFGEKLVIPFTKNSVQNSENGMINDGPYSWMYPYLKLIGFQSGRSMVGGVPTLETLTDTYTEEERELLRQKAAEEMVNISNEERHRRRELSNRLYQVTAIYAGLSAVFLDNGSSFWIGHLYRLLIFLPLSGAYGLQLSANRGL